MTGARWFVVALTVIAVAAIAASYSQPWWRFWLYAPQYPGGLKLTIALTGMSGDVAEINILNHYIGMGRLDSAAPLERRFAAVGVVALGASMLVLALAAGRRLRLLVAAPALSFPATFVLDSFLWLRWFGHHLDPKAPLEIAPFTPQLFGNGVVGQFATYAEPALGFWLACAASALMILAAVVRAKVCTYCGQAGQCGAVCPRGLVLPDRTRSEG
jgi:hypothetical protein